MGRMGDVDEAILHHAIQLLSTVRRREQEVKVDILEDVPSLFVFLFERVTSETIPNDLKPFGNFRERAETLQMILDTLAQTLGLSMSHLSGTGLARLDRRQLADALEIFDDLIQHCFRSEDMDPDEQLEQCSGGRLTMSLLSSPEPAAQETRNRGRHRTSIPKQNLQSSSGYNDDATRGFPVHEAEQLRTAYPSNDEGRSPVVQVHPMFPSARQTGTDVMRLFRTENHGKDKLPPRTRGAPTKPTEDYIGAASTNSSTTLVKEIYRQTRERSTDASSLNRDTATKQRQASAVKDPESVYYDWFSPQLNSGGNLSPDRTKTARNTAVVGTSQERYEPYRKDRQMAKGMKSGTPINVRKPSVKSFNASRQPSDSVSSRKRNAAPRRSVSRECRSGYNKGREPASANTAVSSSNKPRNPGSSMSAPVAGRRPSTRSLYRGQGQERVGQRERNQSNRSVKITDTDTRFEPVGHKVTFKPVASLPIESRRKRVPSIVSTKVKKHSFSDSNDSPRRLVQRSSVKRGQVSPQTTSLYSSFKLLEEFDYVRKRLKEIQTLKQEHLDVIMDLDRERVRLEAVLSHVHVRSRVHDLKTPEGTGHHGYDKSLGVPV